MTAKVLTNNAITLIAPGGAREFLHIFNNTGATIYVCYDGDTAAPLGLTAANGAKILDGECLQLNNDGMKPIFTKPVYGFQNSGADLTVQLQGV